MRIFSKNLILLSMLLVGSFLMISGTVFAQNATPAMLQWSQMEDRTLQIRSDYLEIEAQMQSPIWIKDAQGLYEVIDGEKLRTRVEGFASIAELMIVDSQSIEGFGSDIANSIIASIVAEKIRGVDPVGKILNAYQKYSARNRRALFEELDDMLEFARAQFALELAKREGNLQVGGHPCQQVQPLDARRFFWRYWGNSDWKLLVQNGSYYCEAPRHAPSFNDEEYYAYVIISGEYIRYTECPQGECVTSPYRWKAIHENEGDRHMEGAIYKDLAQESTNGWEGTFNWWQCYPHDGDNSCENDLIVE
ncbi:MAG TPA: hypothetical protein ENK06_05875 [Gammaproteobacteria bacterium]|nr:hypothetical protein [Gammaproteobacteria bacterium]